MHHISANQKHAAGVGRHFFMSTDIVFPHNNGAIHNKVQILKCVILLAAEAKLSALYINAKQAIIMCWMLKEMACQCQSK